MTVTHEETFAATVQDFVRFTEPELDLEDICLEVYAGSAEVSRAIARRVRHASAVDTRAEVLLEGKRAADRDALTNVTFLVGPAERLPHLDRTFTLLLCRDALGSAADPAAVVGELVRVSRPGAGIVLADAGLGVAALVALLEAAGADVKRTNDAGYVCAAAP
ncbi:class I SAM-dependent methyltransferase [Actinocorallia longicatena]|uniref:Methyltransferase type 11 domain-containing protein n=1 Tax=Actinocorallia longicatena TaxID=111803 RepID=A0ABP6Q1J1_9ACTN